MLAQLFAYEHANRYNYNKARISLILNLKMMQEASKRRCDKIKLLSQLFASKIYFQCKNIFPMQEYISNAKISFQCKNIFTVQKYICSAKIYLQYKNIFAVQKYNFTTEMYLLYRY